MDNKAGFQEPMYQQQPSAPNNMAYQVGSNQQLNEKPHTHGSKWVNGFWDCCSPFDMCLMGWCCPCILYGKTQARNDGEKDPSGFGGSCVLWYLLATMGCQGILQTVTRTKYRKRHGIEGDGCMDCLASCCCPLCGLVQEEKESLLREDNFDVKTQQQYQAPAQMQA